jgi:cell division septal protein FtsQ
MESLSHDNDASFQRPIDECAQLTEPDLNDELVTDLPQTQDSNVAQPKSADSAPSRTDILLNTKAVLQTLDALRNEHIQIRDNLGVSTTLGASEMSDNKDKTQVVTRLLEQLELGIGEAQVCCI